MSLLEFHKSTGKELLEIRNRVKNLVKHNLYDGLYKEAIFKNVLKRFLPETIGVGTGFVINKENYFESGEIHSTSQIDILLYDKDFPVLFREGDFVILTPEPVLGLVEVKTNLLLSNLQKEIIESVNNAKMIYRSLQSFSLGKRKKIFNGIISYETENLVDESGNSRLDRITERVREQINLINYQELEKTDIERSDIKHYFITDMCLGNNLFLKSWVFQEEKNISIYKTDELAFSYFISNLLLTITNQEKDMNFSNWVGKHKQDYLLSEMKL